MPKWKKRKLNQPEDVFDISAQAPFIIPPYAIADDVPPEVDRPEGRKEATFRLDRIHNADSANKIEQGLLKLLERICNRYSGYYETYSQSLVNHHLNIFSILGMPIEFSSKALYYNAGYSVGTHTACTRMARASQKRNGSNYHFTEILRLFSWAERSSNNYLYARYGLAVHGFEIVRNLALLFRQLMRLNSLITTRKWEELGRYLNSCIFLHSIQYGWYGVAPTKRALTYFEKAYRSVRHDMYVSALYVWQAGTLRVLQMEESREWKSSRQLAILRRAISQCKYTAGFRVPEHVLLTDSVVVMLSLEEAYMIHHFHMMDMKLPEAHEIYRQPYEAFKLLAQAWCWQEDLRIISGVTDPGSLLVEQLLEIAEREGSAGVMFALSALRGFMKIADVVEGEESLNRLLAYSIGCPRAVRPLAAQMREYGMEEQAKEMIEKAIEPSSAIHPSDPIWLEWAEGKMKEIDEEDEETNTAVAEVLLSYLDYGSNRLNERAWILLEKAMKGSDQSRWSEWWEDRVEWWRDFHRDDMDKRGTKARRKVFHRFAKVRID